MDSDGIHPRRDQDVDIRQVSVNGISMRIAEQGKGPLLLLCHGFPEGWRAWVHQIPFLAGLGYRVVAPDLRGFGGTDAPEAIDAYHILNLVGDLVDLVGQLGETRAIVVGHDCGATLAWNAALMRPDVFHAIAALSIPFRPRGEAPPVRQLVAAGAKDFYWVYFQAPGVAEAEFERDVEGSLAKLYYAASGQAPEDRRLRLDLKPGGGFLDDLDAPADGLAWMSPALLKQAAEDYARTGFRGPLNWYRNFDRNWELTAPWRGGKVTVPALFIAGSEEPFLRTPAGRAALGNLPNTVPGLVRTVTVAGCGHWIQQEGPDAVNAALEHFLSDLAK
jgi:pimeloyl-ACP methyl ester carboxylesterase